jgi:unsaturated rhamnogalacturonyl hydrolase
MGLTNWANGSCGTPGAGSVDGIMHMAACADAYELTMNAGLKGGLDATRRIFDTYPRTKDGAFVHNTGPAIHQNWGDTAFMGQSFMLRYGQVMNDATALAEGVKQVGLLSKHLTNPNGVLFHAYDETGSGSNWAGGGVKNPDGSAHSLEVWGRAMGWFVMTTVMTLEAIPANDPGRPATEKILTDLLTSLKQYQDASGRWWQIVDKGTMAGNWLETSCTAMYTLGTYYAVNHGILDASFCDMATKGFKGVMSQVSMAPARLITNVCQGTNVGDFAYYAGRQHTQFNDPHGIGSFLLMWEYLQ